MFLISKIIATTFPPCYTIIKDVLYGGVYNDI